MLEAGWTPVVGFDPRVGAPPLEPGAVLIDFNKHFQLPTMWLHFPLEFSFLFTERLAFWHADLLLRRSKMQEFATMFAALPDGEMAAVMAPVGLRSLTTARYERRYWEVLGCNTRGSSQSQFTQGAGWWMRFQAHPNTPAADQGRRDKWYWDCGTGIFYWHKKLGGRVKAIPEATIDEGHCTSIKRSGYIRKSPTNARRDLSAELSLNNDLRRVCDELGIGDLVT